MKTILILLVSLLSLPVVAQTRKVDVSASTPNDFATIMAREGDYNTITLSTTAVGPGTTSGGGTYIGGGTAPIGKVLLIDNILIGSSAKVYLRFQFGQLQNFGNTPATDMYVMTPSGGGSVVLPGGRGALIAPGASAGGMYLQRVFGRDSLTYAHNYTFSLSGTLLTADLNFSAAKKMLWIGTSISAGTGPTDTQNMFSFLMRKYLRDSLNYDVRLINRAMSGSTALQTDTYRQRGRYDLSADLIFYEHGTNDAAAGTTTATYLAAVQEMVKMKQRYNPKAYFFIIASPYRNDSFETNLAGYRTALQSYVSGLGDSKVHYISATGSLWNSSTSGTFTTDGIHPNDRGNRLMYWAIRNYIVSNNLVLP